MSYPVLAVVDELKTKLEKHPVVLLQAPPGAGKSTVLPTQLLHEEWLNNRKIVMLEPRRLAARSVAMRMASVKGEEVGQSIGYRVRFDSRVSQQTRIEVVTEGILTRMIQADSALEDVGLLIFDEFHERSLHADLALALSLQVQTLLRGDLRILIMSATLDSENICKVLGDIPVVTSLGKSFPVTLQYIPFDVDKKLEQQVSSAIRKGYTENRGDILVFLPGAAEIIRTKTILEEALPLAKVVALYGDLPFQQQQEAILPSPSGQRKIVLATSIAETSLTIEGVTVVIDSGLARVPRFDPRSGFTRLETVRVTRDAADQRAGRAGRTAPGVCIRLWAEHVHHHLVANRKPEILDADLAPLLLELAEWGVTDPQELQWITPPPGGAVIQASELLHNLEALENNKITARGRQMAALPTHPRLAHMLLKAGELSDEYRQIATDIASLLEEKDPLMNNSVDLALRLQVLRQWRRRDSVDADRGVLERIEKLASTWRKLFKLPVDNELVPDQMVGRLLFEAYPERLAMQLQPHGERYKLANARVARLPQHDALSRERWLVVSQLDAGLQEGRIFLAAAINEQDLMSQAVEVRRVDWDDVRGKIDGRIERRIGVLVLASKSLTTISQEERVNVLLNVVREKGLSLLAIDEEVRQWQVRVLSLRVWRKDEEWPDVSDEALLRHLEMWLAPFLLNITSLSELRKLNVLEMVQTLLSYEQLSTLSQLCPVKLEVPSGSMIRLNYFPDGSAPTMEVRLQELFGLAETPTVNNGRTRVVIHLLSPGYKPVQVTQDLRSFWNSTYSEVKKELRTRYPKHSWPDDPWTAEAVRGVKRRLQP